jgi:uncharacterized protein YggE
MRNRASITLIVSAALATGSLLYSTPANAQEQPVQMDTVTVAANREVDIEPDLGSVSLGVVVHARSAAAATDKLTNRTRQVIQAIEALGFTDDEIETFDVELDRTCLRRCRDRNPDDNRLPDRVLGYRGSAGVRVETERLDALGRIIDTGVESGATRVRGVAFDVKDRNEAVKEALRQAMLVAIEKARILAETGGRQLGRALVIEEGRTRAPERFEVAGAGAAIAGRAGGGGGGGSNPFPVEPPTLSASARVTVTFELI